MSKTIIVVIVTSCAVLLGFERSVAAAEVESAKERIRVLAEKACEANRECDRYFARARRIEGGLSKHETFASRAIALAELTLAEGYPGYPKSSSEILLFLSTLSDSEARDLDVGNLFAAASSCDSVRFYGMLSRLLHSAKVFGFSKADKARLSGVLRRHIDSDLAATRTPLEIELDFKLMKLARQAGFKLKRLPDAEALSGVAKLEADMSVVGANVSLLREVKSELNRATELQSGLREAFKGD